MWHFVMAGPGVVARHAHAADGSDRGQLRRGKERVPKGRQVDGGPEFVARDACEAPLP